MKVILEGTRTGPMLVSIETLTPTVKLPVYRHKPVMFHEPPSRSPSTLDIDVFERTTEVDPETGAVTYRLKA